MIVEPIHHLLSFASGAINEAVAVFWVHHSERGHALKTGICSAIQATALVVGIGEAVHDWHYGPTFIFGYSLGATLAVYLKKVCKLDS